MEKNFFQLLANKFMFKKLTTVFPILRKEALDAKDIENAIANLKRGGIYDALKESGQNPQDLADIALNSFDESVKVMRERFEVMLKSVVTELNKK